MTTASVGGRSITPPPPWLHRHGLVLAGVVGLALAVVLTAAGAPTPVRSLLCLPLLIGISGAATAAVLVREQRRLDGLTRTGLVVLLGAAVLALAALVVAVVFRDGLPATRVAGTHALLTVVPLGILARRGPATTPTRPSIAAPFWSGLAASALVVGALVLGLQLIPERGDQPTFSFQGPAATSPGPRPVAPGAPIPLDWALRNGTGAEPALQAVVDGQAVDLASTAAPADEDEWRGTVTLAAPLDRGVHRIVLSAVLPGQRLELVTYVDVRP